MNAQTHKVRVLEAQAAFRASARGNAQLFLGLDEAVYAAYTADQPLTVNDLAGILGESTALVKARIHRARTLWANPRKRRLFLAPGGGFPALGEDRRAKEEA